jgi:aminopeptidase N
MRTLPVLVVLSLVTTVRAEKPFDFNSTPGKLPKTVVPREYAIRLVPDVPKMICTGSETVKLDARAPVREIVLNAAEMQVSGASVDGKPLPESAIQLDPKQETLTLRLESELPAGAHTLALNFSGKINQQGQGLYVAPYQEQGTGARKTMLGTQFEATDARRVFPCWDEPSFRARFQLTAVVPEDWTAVSNMPAESETKTGGTKEVRFATTPPMASYLNVFVAGELEMIEAQSGPTKIRVVTTKGKSEMGRYALECTAQILRYYNDYFGIAYPLPKLDQIAVPGGFGGAMENWGGITYYESGLLFDPKNSSVETKQNIYAVIAHEMAHQWFGDLVTMAWWDNLWLNEGFASWMGSKCTAHFNPQWEVWLRRGIPRDPSRRHGIPKETAMEGDARATTHAIQQIINTEAEANSAFDDITYHKGQSFLRMLESFLGENVFRDGIRKYIAAHKYSNSTTADLWDALGEASGKPVVDIAAAWTQQPGFPLVSVRRDGGKLSLTQERFTVHWQDAPPLQWQIPLTYAAVGGKPATLLMTGKTAEVPNVPADRAVKLNLEGAGNYRVQYDDPSWKLLSAQFAKLSAPDRVNLLADTWAFVQANRAALSQYYALAAKLPSQPDLAEAEQVIGVFDFVNRLLAGEPARDKFQSYARGVLRAWFDRVGWEPKNNAPPRTATLRASLVAALGELNDREVVAGCHSRFEKFVANPASLQPDLRAPVLAVVGRYADEATWNKLHELGVKTTSIEEKGILYQALASTLDAKLADKTLQISLSDELPTSRAIFLVSRVARESERPDIVWSFAKGHMKELLGKTDALGANSFAPSLFTFFSDENRTAELQSYAKSDLSPAAATDVAKATDELGFRAEFKKRLLAQMR